MLTEGGSNFLLLISLFYIVYLQYKLGEANDEIEEKNQTMFAMAQELQALGSPNVRMQYVSSE